MAPKNINAHINQIALLIFILLFSYACSHSFPNTALMPEAFWDKGENQDMPVSFEAVNIDANGKETGDGGTTHLNIKYGEIGVEYEILDNSTEALDLLNDRTKGSLRIIRKGIIKDLNGNQVGEKILVVRYSYSTGYNYALMWTRNSRFTEISSEYYDAVTAYEIDRNL